MTLTHRVQHVCVGCGKRFSNGYTTFCDGCDQMIDVAYDLDRGACRESDNPLVLFFDLPPIEQGENLARRGVPRPDQTVLVNLTGRDRAREPSRARIHWLERTPSGWTSEDGAEIDLERPVAEPPSGLKNICWRLVPALPRRATFCRPAG
jgi:hypothetical protein